MEEAKGTPKEFVARANRSGKLEICIAIIKTDFDTINIKRVIDASLQVSRGISWSAQSGRPGVGTRGSVYIPERNPVFSALFRSLVTDIRQNQILDS